MNKNKKKIILLSSFFVLIFFAITFVLTYGQINTPVVKQTDPNKSHISGNTVYINEYESDYYYYKGLNYTYNDNTGYNNSITVPNLNDQNIYNNSNLVQVKITYKGIDSNGNHGYVSLNELQDTYIYNKIYNVENNYVTIELIDNPFTNRPTDMGFNGWITGYKNASIIYDSTYDTYYAKIPVTYSNNIPNLIDITFNASWVKANIGYTNGSFNNAFNNLKDKKMIKIDTVNNGNYINGYNDKSIMAGTYRKVVLSANQKVQNLYDANGNYIENDTCWWQCEYYEYLNYYKDNNSINYIDKNSEYYYFNNKNTNIIVMNTNISGDWNNTKPFTLTSIHNGIDYRNSVTWDVSNSSIVCQNDTTIENIKISSNKSASIDLPSSNNNAKSTFYARWFNVKIGRGIMKSGNYTNFTDLMGGYNENIGRDYETKKYKFIVESGYYNNISLTNGTSNTSKYVNLHAILGSDYDKASENNSALNIYYTVASNYGGLVDAPVYQFNDAVIATIKSGSFGSNNENENSGFILGGIFGGTSNSPKDVFVEGGYIHNLIGDSTYIEDRKKFINTKMYIKDGIIDMVFGGAPSKTTYGHRFIQMTGGTVNYSIIGGNNNGLLDGNTLVYIGGTSIVGNQEINETLYDIESGYIFGSGKDATVSTSNIIINDNPNIKSAIFLGGINKGTTTGVSKLKVIDGKIENIYGGNYKQGIMNSDISIIVNGGTINNIYGGGKNEETFSNGNIDIITGENYTNPKINSLYGGSEFGIVNGNKITDEVSSKNVNINIYNGEITNVYGGSKGSENITPYVLGKTNVIISGGKLTNVYGANDINGQVNGGAKLYLNGGIIENAYGGGNSSSINSTYLEINGATVYNAFGGCNVGGTATITNVVMSNGTITSLHGGNDHGGFSEISNVNINGGTITNVYGGGRYAKAGITNLSLNNTNVINAYGGGENADVTVKTNVKLNGSNVTNLFGGSDSSGIVEEANITLVAGTVDNIFGGNNLGGFTKIANVDVNGSTTQTIYGGGNAAPTGDTNVIIRGSNNKMKNVYGGSKSANVENAKIDILGGMFENIYGGSHLGGTVNNSTITVDSTKTVQNDVFLDITTDIQNVTWQSNKYRTIVDITVKFTNNTDVAITNYNGTLVAPGSTLFSNYTSTALEEDNGVYTFSEINRYWGTNIIEPHKYIEIKFSILTNETKETFELDNMFDSSDINGKKYNSSSLQIPKIDNIYGGNNNGGHNENTSITIKDGLINNVYGGGNNATNGNTNILINGGEIFDSVYGGGNNAISENTNIIINQINIGGNVFGGGNNGGVNHDTNTYLHNTNVSGSVYAGGNGENATTFGNTNLNIDGSTKITNHCFGGGNAASLGSEKNNNSISTVNIAGATINGNLYGGANTSVVYGKTNLNIGSATINKELVSGDIYIGGTVFGGGEANSEGSEIYDYSFISVTDGTNINIDPSKNNNYQINGSIFGSGNASSSEGDSFINIKNYGNSNDIRKNISIQRTTTLTIDNSYLELLGATDRTNEYSDILYSLSRIDELKLKNDSNIYLKNGANVLKKLTSLNKENEKAKVKINEDGTYNNDSNNRIYLYEKTNLNVALNEQATVYGEVSGMTYLGMYKYENNTINKYLYDQKYDSLSKVNSSDLYAFNDGIYVLGRHMFNHEIDVDGFYTSKQDLENLGTIKYEYVNPTPKDANYYMWVVGELVVEYEFDLTASKYSTLGTYELPLINSSSANTTFKVLDFDYSELNSNVSLEDPNSIPRIASGNKANNTFGLEMKTSNTGWITVGETKFLSNDSKYVNGTNNYVSDNSNIVPSLLFSLYHSKNITSTDNLGSVKITLLTITPIDEVNNKIERINIIINLKTALYSTNDYEGAMTKGEEFDIFTPTRVDITANSKLSAYYSLYMESKQNIYHDDYHRVLLSNFVLPENTRITMVDLNTDKKEYYYYVVTKDDVIDKNIEYNKYKEVTYDFSKFVKMGSSSKNNNYNDKIGNNNYYKSGYAHEEFIFIVDFSDTEIKEDKLNNTLLVELRDSNDRTIHSVLGVQHSNLTYNIYKNKNAKIGLETSLDTKKLYLGTNSVLTIDTDFVQQDNNGTLIYDTAYFDKKLGVMISLVDKNGKVLTGTDLLGLVYEYEGIKYYPRVDGTVRINLAQRVANISSKIMINTKNAHIASGEYKIRISSFGSADGIYYGLVSSETKELDLIIIDTQFGLSVNLPKKSVILDKTTGKGLNDNNALVFNINYSSGLSNPNLTLSLYRRDYSKINSNEYEKVDLKDYITNNLKEKADLDYLVTKDLFDEQKLFIYTKDKLVTGTYKFVFTLYDGDTYIGDVYQYIIIK